MSGRCVWYSLGCSQSANVMNFVEMYSISLSLANPHPLSFYQVIGGDISGWYPYPNDNSFIDLLCLNGMYYFALSQCDQVK